MGKRRKARELAIQVLFHLEFNTGEPEGAFALIAKNFDSGASIIPFSRILVLGVCENKEALDNFIKESSKNWSMERMTYLDKSILRLSTYELLFRGDIPPKVSIDEAVELAKKFGGDDSARFVNGVLDNIYSRQGEDSLSR
jgi:transcription antitermination factor NusB